MISAYPGARVLIIDDEPQAVELVRRLLAHIGLTRVQGLSEPLHAVEVFRAFEPDLVILDLVMPTRSGYDVLSDLRGQMEFVPVPIMVLTSDIEAYVRCAEMGARDFESKPIEDVYRFLMRVETLLEVRALRMALQTGRE